MTIWFSGGLEQVNSTILQLCRISTFSFGGAKSIDLFHAQHQFGEEPKIKNECVSCNNPVIGWCSEYQESSAPLVLALLLVRKHNERQIMQKKSVGSPSAMVHGVWKARSAREAISNGASQLHTRSYTKLVVSGPLFFPHFFLCFFPGAHICRIYTRIISIFVVIVRKWQPLFYFYIFLILFRCICIFRPVSSVADVLRICSPFLCDDASRFHFP